MKRAVQAITSMFSPNKRQRKEVVSTTPKRVRPTDVNSQLDALERIQSRLLSLDKQCAAEQLEIQLKYDSEKRPILDQRKDVISEIPGFWMTAIGNHPMTNSAAFHTEDRYILQHLCEIEIYDNLDINGSYNLIFKFLENNIYFSESEIIRKINISNDQSESISVSPISWAPKKKPKSPTSFFAWLASTDTQEDDFGEVLRRDLWQNPYPYYLNISPTMMRGEVV